MLTSESSTNRVSCCWPVNGYKRFYKGDMVRDVQDGHLYIVGQIISNGPSLILARHVETINVNLLIGSKGRKKVSGRQILRLEVIEDV